jgi:hypothetical protein
MKKIYVGIILGILLSPLQGYSQYFFSKFSNHNEFEFGMGPSQFLGDLGGSAGVGTHFLGDFNFSAIRYSFQGGYSYHILPQLAARAMFTAGMLYGDDALSSEPYRHNRNLNFRSPILEIAAEAQYYFYRSSNSGHHYHIKHARGFSNFNVDAYIFLGIGGFYFNPQGKYKDGTWYDLRPLSTEGEGLPGGPPTYSQLGLCFPAGIGAKYHINPQWAVGVEISTRLWTSSDYIDDTHGKYFDSTEIAVLKGPIAAYFADPSLRQITGEIPPNTPGQIRGDATHNDTYMFTFVTLTYQPPYRKRTRSKF